MIIQDSFYEKFILLMITALISGIVVPLILNYRTRKQKQLDEFSQKQTEKLKEQSKLIDELTTTLWTWRYLSMKVVYYATVDKNEKYEDAVADYEKKVWDLLCNFKIQNSKARRLLSEDAFLQFSSFYHYIVREIDPQIMQLIESKSQKSEFQKLATYLNNYLFKEVSVKIDEELLAIYLHFNPLDN